MDRREFLAGVFGAGVVTCGDARAENAPKELLQLIRVDQESGRVAPGAWPDVSLRGLQRLEARDRATMARLRAIPRKKLNPNDRELYDLLEWQLGMRLEQMRVRLYLTPFWQDSRCFPDPGRRLLGALEPLWSLPRPVTLRDYENRIRKFQVLPQYVKQVIALLHAAKDARMLPAASLVSGWAEEEAARLSMLALTQGLFGETAELTPAERQLYAPFASMDGMDAPDRQRLQQTARSVIRDQVIPALQEHSNVLMQEYLPACPKSPSLTAWPNGAEVYRVLLRFYTTTDLDPKRVQEIGFKEVKRIHKEMVALMTKTGFKGTLNEFLAYARTDPRFYFKTGAELLAAYRGAIQEIQPLLPKVVHNIPKLSLTVKGSPQAAGDGYVAPKDGLGEGIIGVSIGSPSTHPQFVLVPIVLHEGMPGHALQNAVEQEYAPKTKDTVSTFEKQARQSMGFTEGWAFYAEELGENMGLYRTPMDRFGALRMQLTRAVRIATDTGVHMSGWTMKQAKAYASAMTGEPGDQIEYEVARVRYPGAQPSYMIGKQQIEAMRRMAAKRQGKAFDLCAFHDLILRWGSLPLTVLRRKLIETNFGT